MKLKLMKTLRILTVLLAISLLCCQQLSSALSSAASNGDSSVQTQEAATLKAKVDTLEKLFVDGFKKIPGCDKGDPGAPGEDGQKGMKGIKGEEGLQGNDGARGGAGKRGPKGVGIKGEKGNPGPKGETGLGGQTGNIGPKGERGALGIGMKGEKGNIGPIGETGVRGEKGSVGLEGEMGAPGSGMKGEKGTVGPKGEMGASGSGIKGEKGNFGPKGEIGARGATGSIGPEGEKGEIGEINNISSLLDALSVTYTRWGRTICPSGAEVVYNGRVGGEYYSNPGGGTNYQCLPDIPIYDEYYNDGRQDVAYMYNAEYKVFDFNPFKPQVRPNDDVPCAVCRVKGKTSLIVIPARNVCPSGWRREYYGYLMTGMYNDHPHDIICVDRHAEAVPGTRGDKSGALLYFVDGKCSHLLCGPYKNNAELTCAVCSV